MKGKVIPGSKEPKVVLLKEKELKGKFVEREKSGKNQRKIVRPASIPLPASACRSTQRGKLSLNGGKRKLVAKNESKITKAGKF